MAQAGLETPGSVSSRGRQESLAGAFADVCARNSERVAVCCGDDQATYGELHELAGRITAGFAGVATGGRVAILLERSVGMVAAMLGVVGAGAAYVPVDPETPVARVLELLEDCRPMALITDERWAGMLGDLGFLVIVPETLPSVTSGDPAAAGWDDPAYVIYTSGTTGKPKGVVVSQGNVLRLLSSTEAWFHFDEHDVWTMFHSFAFDFSVWEMWGCLLTGGRLVVVPFAVSRAPEQFRELLARERVTVLNQTPTAFSQLMAADAEAASELALRVVIFGGEALVTRSLQPWFTRHGDARPQLVNMYGITETTVHVTYRRVLAADCHEAESLIGEAIPDLQVHLLDTNLQPVQDGETGEICVSGAGVALGYFGRAELTAERFVRNPFANGMMYRSGDLARRRAVGELVYLGRVDRQVKINGFRIELGEVEAVLGACPGVRQVCVVDAAQRLDAYVVGGDLADVKAFAHANLSAHMRPSTYMAIAALPLNRNGKLDRGALPLPGLVAAARLAGSALEDRIAAIWAGLLGLAEVGLEENFFEQGGTSLLLIALRAKLMADLKIDLPIAWLFEHGSVRSLAARISSGATSRKESPGRGALQRAAFARMRELRQPTEGTP